MALLRTRAGIALGAIAVVLAAAAAVFVRDTEPVDTTEAAPRNAVLDSRTRNSAVDRACALDQKVLVRIWRGFDETHSPDITIVPAEPNYWGTFLRVSHTGPWDYLQRIPLVLYGPERIAASGQPLEEHVNITDVYATVGELLNVDLPTRDSDALDDAIRPDASGTPKLAVVVVWDGVGQNMLRRWPSRWPFLAKLQRIGTSYENVTVGSSPSVTPPTHTNMATGAFPRDHKVITIEYRGTDRKIHQIFEGSDPTQLKLTTFGDEIDRSYGNRSKVGMLGWSVAGTPAEGPGAWTTNHLGMLGHGTAIEGGDRDEEALIGDTGNITGNPDFYKLPSYLENFSGLEQHADKLDRADGKADGRWLGHEILGEHDNPAWVDYELDVLTTMIRRSGYGADDVPDVLLTNFKMTDIAGHRYSIDSREVAETLEAQDDALRRLVGFLDQRVGDYVVIVTADHGHTRDPSKTGAWPISPQQLVSDIDDYFNVPEGKSLVQASEPVGLYIRKRVARALNLGLRDIEGFLNAYRIRHNWPEEDLPDGYEDRGSERVLAAAFTTARLPAVMNCAFGSETPPPHLDA